MDNNEYDDELLRKQIGTRQMRAQLAMLVGGVLGLASYWMFIDAGGTLITAPETRLYMIPGVPAIILAIYGWRAIWP